MPVAAGTVGEALGAAVDALGAAGVDSPRLDAELLFENSTGVGRAALAAAPETEVSPAAARRFGEDLRRRLRREPLAYVLGSKGFRRIELEVDRRVLVPRPETELLVELALEVGPSRLLDVGTGSGAIALAVADELPGCAVTATDTSPGALELARHNARGWDWSAGSTSSPGRCRPIPGPRRAGLLSTWSSPTCPTSPSATGPRCSPR